MTLERCDFGVRAIRVRRTALFAFSGLLLGIGSGENRASGEPKVSATSHPHAKASAKKKKPKPRHASPSTQATSPAKAPAVQQLAAPPAQKPGPLSDNKSLGSGDALPVADSGLGSTMFGGFTGAMSLSHHRPLDVPAGAVAGAAVPGLAGAVWADRDSDGEVDGYNYKGQYYMGAPKELAPGAKDPKP